jgi:hypothetical protein
MKKIENLAAIAGAALHDMLPTEKKEYHILPEIKEEDRIKVKLPKIRKHYTKHRQNKFHKQYKR